MTKMIELQERQDKHDKNHHRDIYSLSFPERMNHYTLHFSKYVGRMARSYPDEVTRQETVEQTIADCFIVGLAASNVLNMSLDEELENMFGLDCEGLSEWVGALNDDEQMTVEDIQIFLFENLAPPTGEIANALESLDHMEAMETRDIIEAETLEIIANLLIVAGSLDADLEEIVEHRWSEIEEQSIM